MAEIMVTFDVIIILGCLFLYFSAVVLSVGGGVIVILVGGVGGVGVALPLLLIANCFWMRLT